MMLAWTTFWLFLVTASSANQARHQHSHASAIISRGRASGGKSIAAEHGRRECRIPASMTGISAALVEASVKCSRDARIVVEAGDSLIDEVIVMNNLANVEVSILGNLHLKPDWAYWKKNGFRGIPEDTNTTVVWSYVGGTNVHVNGGGTFYGNGLSAWKAYFKNSNAPRPALVLFSGVNGGSYSNLRHIDSPAWNLYLYKTHHFRVFNYQLEIHDGGAGSDTEAKNTDACNTRDSSFIEIFHSRMYNTDDIIAIKSGSSHILVHDIIGAYRCGGLSIGSLGNIATKFETAKNITFDHVEMRNCRAGPRVKAWAGKSAAIKDLSGGGGAGLMQDITFRNINLKDVETGIVVETCYGVKQTNDDCFGAPTKVVIKNLHFNNIVGTVRPKAPWSDAAVANIQCSAGKEGCPGLKIQKAILVDAFNRTLNPWHCGGLVQGDLPGVLCDYPKYTKRRWNGTVQFQIGPKPEIYGPLINHPVLPIGYTDNIPAKDGLWKPRYPLAPKTLPFVRISQPEWPQAWERAIAGLVSPPPRGDALPKSPHYGLGDDEDQPGGGTSASKKKSKSGIKPDGANTEAA